MRLGRDLGEDLALESQSHQRRIRPDASQQAVVVALSVPQAGARAVEGHAGHDHQIKLAGVDAPVAGFSQIALRLQDPVRAGHQLLDARKQEEPQIVGETIGDDDLLSPLQGGGEERTRADLAAEVDVAHHRAGSGVLGQGSQPFPDDPACLVLVGLGLPTGPGLPADRSLPTPDAARLFLHDCATTEGNDGDYTLRPGSGRSYPFWVSKASLPPKADRAAVAGQAGTTYLERVPSRPRAA